MKKIIFLGLWLITLTFTQAAKFIRPYGNTTAWESTSEASGNIITAGVLNALSSLTNTETYYFAAGTYTFNSTIVITTGKFYGGFTGNETAIDLSARALYDADGNGMIEPWEFSNETKITSTLANSSYDGSGTNSRFFTVTGGEVNGLTFTDYNYSGGSGAIALGQATASPTDLNNTTEKAGKMTLCIVRKIKTSANTSHGVVMLTNTASTVDNCLIEDCRVTSGSGGAVYMNKKGGTVSNSVIRNNIASARGGAIWLNNTPASTVDAIISNCVIYNNSSATGGVIRGEAAASPSKGLQIVNCTVVNNATTGSGTASVELINSGLLVNSLVLSDSKIEINSFSTNYITSTIYGASNGSSYPGTNNVSGIADNTFSNIYFKTPTNFQGAVGNVGESEYDATNAAAIKTANYSINNALSLASTTTGVTTLPAIFKATGGVGADIDITATIPTTDINGVIRTGNYTIGAYQATLSVVSAIPISIDQNAYLAQVTVDAGAQLTLSTGKVLTTTNFIINSNSTVGTGTFVDLNSSGGLTVSGTTNVQQYLTSLATGVTGRNWYISSPLSAATSSTITTATGNGLVYYNVGNASWDDSGTTMEVMKGYIAKSPAQNTTISFIGGNLNTGSQSVYNLPVGFNLVGNPYPSYVNWTEATKSNITNSIWYRSKKSGSYNFHTYNVTGGVGVNDGTDIIPPMQSFWIKTTNSTNSLTFNNAMRSHQDQSIETNRLKAPKASTQKLLRLQVSNGQKRDETVLYFNSNAQNSIDEFDSQKMFNNVTDVPEIYTQIETEKLVVNGMNEVQYDTEIPLGFSTLQANDFSIKVSEFNNFDSNTIIILKDNDQQTEQDLTVGTAYNFESGVTNTSNRFSLIFRAPGNATGVDKTIQLNAHVFVNTQNQITIIAPEKCSYAVYNVLGQKQLDGKLKSTRESIDKRLNSGIYFVELSTNVQSKIQKVIIR